MKLQKKLIYDYYLGGILLFLLRLIAQLVSVVTGPPRDATPKGDIAVMKMLGGGSVIIGFPSLLGLREAYRDRRLVFIGSPGTTGFAGLLDVFDEIVEIDDRSLVRLATSSLRAWIRLRRIDVLVDLELHSRLSAVFTAMSLVRRRFGFYSYHSFSREYVYTHLVYHNPQQPIYHAYDAACRALAAEPATPAACRGHLRAALKAPAEPAIGEACIAPCCSDLSPERMLRPEHWVKVLAGRNVRRLELLGGKADQTFCEEVRTALLAAYPHLAITNLAGKLSLRDSVLRLARTSQVLAVDSGLLHIARIVAPDVVSWWGPTDPRLLLRPHKELKEMVHYRPIACSPCVHMTKVPPCRGDNICIKNLFADVHQRPNLLFMPLQGSYGIPVEGTEVTREVKDRQAS